MADTTQGTPSTSPEVSQPGRDTAQPDKPDRVEAYGNLGLGGILIAIDALDHWVDRNVPSEAQARDELAKGRAVLLPQAEWEAAHGPLKAERARYATIGLAVAATERAKRAARFTARVGSEAVAVARWPLDHIWLLAPVRKGLDRLVEAGNEQVDGWVQLGRRTEEGTRAVAEVSLKRAAGDSVDLMTVEPHVQVLIQEIIAAQGQSITKEIIREVREHSVSLDMKVDWAWATLRGRPSVEVVKPDFPVAIRGQEPFRQQADTRPYLGGGYAGFISRFLAFCIDIFVLIIALVIGWVFVRSIISIFGFDRLLPGLFGPGASVARIVGPSAMATLIACVYWLFGWLFTGETAGKLVMGLRVVGPGGSRLGFWRAVRRVIGYFLSMLAVGLGFLWVIVNRQHHSWADKLAGTSVVYAWHARPDETFLRGPSPER